MNNKWIVTFVNKTELTFIGCVVECEHISDASAKAKQKLDYPNYDEIHTQSYKNQIFKEND